MPARILDGTKIANDIKAELVAEVRGLTEAGARPGLAVVLVGNDPGSEIYVRHKVKACEELGIYSEKFTPEDNVSTDELLKLIDDLNRRDEIDGILVQLPLPKQVDSKRVLLAVDPQKDVDGFHPLNVGNLSTQRPGLVSCTPAGCMEILRRSGIAVEGQNAVLGVGSDILGKPVAWLSTNATPPLTLCHPNRRDLPAVCRTGEILVAAIGKPGVIIAEMVKPGATVVD